MRLPIKGYEGLYEVSDSGQVFSLERLVVRVRDGKSIQQFVPSCERICSKHGTGYLTVRLAKNGKVKTHRVHRLVAEAFIENAHNKPFVNHVDGDKHNNAATNLEWVTEQENITHAIVTGLKPANERCPTTGKYLRSEV